MTAAVVAAFTAAIAVSTSQAAAPPKVTLKVTVAGKGGVAAGTFGLRCPGTCLVHVRKGAHVVLRATPAHGWSFIGWLGLGTCGAGRTCATTMTGARSLRAVFHALPAPVAPQPLPPLPPPPAPTGAKPGHYVGSYSDGSSPLTFDIDSTGTRLTNFSYDDNGHCSNGGTIAGSDDYPGPFLVASDGSFGTQGTTKYSDQVVTVAIKGTITPEGNANGTISVEVDFTNGPSCSSSGVWSAHG